MRKPSTSGAIKRAPAQPSRRIPDWKQIYPLVIACLTVSLMMICLTYAFVQLGERIFTGWSGIYLLPFVFLVSLEAQISRRLIRSVPIFSKEWFVRRGSEWVVLLVALKVTLYLVHGPAQFLVDAVIWQKDFFGNFFDSQYLIGLGFTLVIWFFSGYFAELQFDLEENGERVDREIQGYVEQDRIRARKHLIGLIFSLGVVMLTAAALVRMDLEALNIVSPTRPIRIWNLMAYFLLGLFLLSQSQLSMLRAGWALAEIPVSDQIGSRWILIGLGFLVGLALIVAFLPTHYSVGLLGILSIVVSLLFLAFNMIGLVILLPFFLIFSLLSMLFGFSNNLGTLPRMPFNPPAPTPAFSDPVWELIKSFIFWSLFFGIIFFSLRSYLRQRRELWESLRSAPLLRWLVLAWEWLIDRLRGARLRFGGAISSGWKNITSRTRSRLRAAIGGRKIPTSQNPRDQVIAVYLDLVRDNAENGCLRHPAQTPDEYAQTMLAAIPGEDQPITAITGAFDDARYSRHDVHASQAQRVRAWWRRIRRAFHLLRERRSGS